MHEDLEVQAPKAQRAGRSPTEAERDHHYATGHAVFRSWCAACCAARAIGHRHESRAEDRDEGDADPVISIDFAFMSGAEGAPAVQPAATSGPAVGGESREAADEEEKAQHKMLVAKDRRYKVIAATAVESKAVADYPVKWLRGLLLHLGYRRCILQSDGEPAICALKNACVLRTPEVECVLRESPPGDHQANGDAEVSVREIKRQVRTLRYALEARLGRTLREDHPILEWMPMLAGDAITRYRLGRDGMSAEQRRTGRKWDRATAEFGERVWFRAAEAVAPGSGMQPKLSPGIFLGHHARTAAVLVMTPGGVQRATGFKRMPVADRWADPDGSWDRLRGLPWDVSGQDPPGEAREALPVAGPASGEPALRGPEPPRARYVTQADLRRYGATVGCPACAEIAVHGRSRVAHTTACRDRVGAKMAEDESGKARLEEHQRKREGDAGPAAPEAGPGGPEPGALTRRRRGVREEAPDGGPGPSEKRARIAREKRERRRTRHGSGKGSLAAREGPEASSLRGGGGRCGRGAHEA